MWKYSFYYLLYFIVNIASSDASTLCGCKSVRPCYQEMIDALKTSDEVACMEDAAIGTSTIMIFLKAVQQYCGEYISVNEESFSYNSRQLYEVVMSAPPSVRDDVKKPVIIVEAGQQAGTESVGLALYLIEQLVACEEYHDMLQKVQWVVLPSTNPDGMEYAKYNRELWKKNVRPSDDNLSFGVDITRNFNSQWAKCDPDNNGFSPNYPGPSAASENETMFIQNVLLKYKTEAKAYLSIRRNGHAIMYPFAHTKSSPPSTKETLITKVAVQISSKVNQRAGVVQVFLNNSIFNINGKPHCGHSVDYAYGQGIPYTYEMRVFLGSDTNVMSMFHSLPRGYEHSLRAGYFSGIRELHNIITNDKKQAKLF